MSSFEQNVERSSGKSNGYPSGAAGGAPPIRHAEERFEHIVDGIRDYAIFLLDAGGRVQSWNTGAERIKGYRAEEIIGEHFSRFYTEPDMRRDWPARELREAEATGRFEDEGWRVRKDGTRFWANVVITALKDDAGKLRGFLKITRDLTERKRVEEALRQSEERFRLLVEGVRDYAIFLLDPEGRVQSWNPGAERTHGYRAEEIIGGHFSRFYTEPDIRRDWPARELQEAAATGRFEDEGWRVRKDGTRFWANVVITALRNGTGQLVGFAKVTRDLTERKEAEEALRRANADLERRVAARTAELTRANAVLQEEIAERWRIETALKDADRRKNEFLAMLGHELRNPLAPIRNALHLLRMPGAPEAEVRELADTLERQVEHLVRLVDDLLDVARIMQGRIELKKETVGLGEILRRAVETSRPFIDAHGHELIIAAPTEPVFVEADPIRMSQAVGNLLNNSAKYTEDAGRIWLSAGREGDRAVIRVRDNGIGIDPLLIPDLFDLFVQGPRGLARSQGGLGIGLTLVKRLIEMHGGTIEAHSAGPGRGSEFVIRLAAARPPDVQRSGRGGGALGLIPAARRRILIVDDNVDAARSLAKILKRWGHDVRTAFDGPSALEEAGAYRPDVMLLDIGLPGMDGYEVARRLRAEPRFSSLALAAITGYGQDVDHHRSSEAGFDRHFTKPIDPDALGAFLASLGSPAGPPAS